MILIDSSVLIDLLEKTPKWFAWSAEQLFAASERDQIGINAIVYAEISRSFASHAASAAHAVYRANGGTRTATSPDFFIGAHASVEGYTLMTRDATRIHTYFPNVPSISPP